MDRSRNSSGKIALSTSWNAGRHDSGQKLAEEISGLGVNQLELNYHISKDQLADILALREKGIIKVRSLHNFCPVPDGLKNGKGDDYLLSSLKEGERLQAVEYTLQTIKWAKRLGAEVVVLHLGQVNLKKDFQRSLAKLLAEGKKDTGDFQSTFERMKKERAGLIKPHFEALKRSLDQITKAMPAGIKLGFENRYYYHEIPLLEELEELLERYGSVAGYWHDTGHAHTLESLSFYPRNEFIKRLGKYLIGIHLHDAVNTDDHLAPGRGVIDFAYLAPYLKNDPVKVMELKPGVKKEEIIKGLKYLESVKII